MEYRRQVAMQRDGDDFVIAFESDGFIIFRNKDADALRLNAAAPRLFRSGGDGTGR
jgi:hypothetical protein